MPQPRPKIIKFDEEMNNDFTFIQSSFKEKFGVIPTNSSIMNLLLETYKNTRPNIKRKPRSKRTFLVEV